MALPELQRRSPLPEPKEFLHKNGIYLDAQAARTLGVRSGEVMRQRTTPADDARRVRESIDDCEPCQESKPDC